MRVVREWLQFYYTHKRRVNGTMTRGVPRRKPRTAEELVCHDEERCQAGAKVRLAWECENVDTYPWLKVFHGQIGELVKPLGTGWGWLARFGDVEGTFRTRDVCMLAYANLHDPLSDELDRADRQRTGSGGERTGFVGRVSIGGAEDEFQPEVLSARTPRGVGAGRATPRGIIKFSEEASHQTAVGDEYRGATASEDAASAHADHEVLHLMCYRVSCHRS